MLDSFESKRFFSLLTPSNSYFRKLIIMVVLAFAESSAIQLVPDGTILIHIALILIMIWVLNRTFFRPINRVIEAREKNKGGRFGAAEEILHQVAEKNARFEGVMREARSEGYNKIESERSAALIEKQAKVEAAKAEAEQKLAVEKDSIVRQTEEARRQIAAEARVLAEKISSNILK
jgi:F0F1-type ATP synthase membrane subunit b/b'